MVNASLQTSQEWLLKEVRLPFFIPPSDPAVRSPAPDLRYSPGNHPLAVDPIFQIPHHPSGRDILGMTHTARGKGVGGRLTGPLTWTRGSTALKYRFQLVFRTGCPVMEGPSRSFAPHCLFASVCDPRCRSASWWASLPPPPEVIIFAGGMDEKSGDSLICEANLGPSYPTACTRFLPRRKLHRILDS